MNRFARRIVAAALGAGSPVGRARHDRGPGRHRAKRRPRALGLRRDRGALAGRVPADRAPAEDRRA
jgi:hypothetical protein